MGWVLLYAVVLFLLLFFCLNHLRCLMIRLSCAWQIRKMCRRGKAKLHRAHLFWFLGSRFGRHCDFYLETPHCIFSIKLFGVMRRYAWLVLMRKDQYQLQGTLFGRPVRPFGNYDFRYRFRPEWEGKAMCPVVLMNPEPHDIRIQKPGKQEQKEFTYGDQFAGVMVFSLALLQAI